MLPRADRPAEVGSTVRRRRRVTAWLVLPAGVAILTVLAWPKPGADAVAKPVRARTPTYGGLPCAPPTGHRVVECRLGVHGIPDLSRRRFARLRQQELTMSEPLRALVSNPENDGRADWPLVDSLAKPMGRLAYDAERERFRLTDLAGTVYSVVAVNVRGRGCAASATQARTFPLVQIIAPKVPSHGTQAFVDGRALDPATTAFRRFARQRGGGTGCGPAGAERGRVQPLRDPAVGATAHARLSDGTINTVTEYDAKAPFGGTVYFMTNTTGVRVGGITRGMVRIGTPVAKVDEFRTCDPTSDGTLTWRYWSIRTGNPAKPRIYGWIPARCTRR